MISLILRIIRSSIFFFIILVLTYNLSFAQISNINSKTSDPIIILYLGIPYSTYDNQCKESQGIGNGLGWVTLGLDAVFYNFLLIGSELGWDRPTDEEEFTNNTSSGKITSGVSLWQYSLFGGIKIPDIHYSTSSNSYIFGNINFGNMWSFFEERSIGNCIDCDQEKLDINGGLFVNPEIFYVFDEFALGLSYRHFWESDYKSKIELKLAGVIK